MIQVKEVSRFRRFTSIRATGSGRQDAAARRQRAAAPLLAARAPRPWRCRALLLRPWRRREKAKRRNACETRSCNRSKAQSTKAQPPLLPPARQNRKLVRAIRGHEALPPPPPQAKHRSKSKAQQHQSRLCPKTRRHPL